MKFLFVMLLLVSCGHKPQESKPSPSDLQTKAETYLSLAPDAQGLAGFLPGCDSLLFSSLYKIGGAQVDLRAARKADGSWQRHPDGKCFPGESKSSISRDMLLGLMLATWVFKDKQTADELVAYGQENNWVMGKYDGSVDGQNRVTFTPQFIGLAYRLRWKLGGQYHVLADTPQSYFPVEGYEAHLQGLRILLLALMDGKVDQIQLNTLKAQSQAQPDNALFAALAAKFDPDLAGDQTQAIQVLSDERIFPAGRLPNTHDRCVDYIFNHEKNDADWQPCDPLKVHSAADYLFAYWVVTRNSFGFRSRYEPVN